MITREDLMKMGYKEPHKDIFRGKDGSHCVILDGKLTPLSLLGRPQIAKLGLDIDLLRELVHQEVNSIKDSRLEDHQEAKSVEAEVVKDTELVPVRRDIQEHRERVMPQIVEPIVSVDEVISAFEKFEDIKKRVWTDEDYINVGGKKIPRKSAWRKISVPFNLNVEILEEERVDIGFGEYEWRFTIRVMAPNGRFCDGVGSCNTFEDYAHRQMKSMASKMKKEVDEILPIAISHFIRSMAMTRAESRAISDLVGGGGGIEEDLDQPNEK